MAHPSDVSSVRWPLPLRKPRPRWRRPARQRGAAASGARRLSLLLEAAQPVGVLGERGGKHFDRHLTLQACVPRGVHLSHSSGSQGRENLVRTKATARRKRHLISIHKSHITNLVTPPITPPTSPRPAVSSGIVSFQSVFFPVATSNR